MFAAPARPERSKKDMTVEEIEADENPIMEVGGFEYRVRRHRDRRLLDPADARALARELKAAMRDAEESTEGGPPDKAVATSSRVPQAVYGGESRTSVWNSTWPWSMIGWMENSCTTFRSSTSTPRSLPRTASTTAAAGSLALAFSLRHRPASSTGYRSAATTRGSYLLERKHQ